MPTETQFSLLGVALSLDSLNSGVVFFCCPMCGLTRTRGSSVAALGDTGYTSWWHTCRLSPLQINMVCDLHWYGSYHLASRLFQKALGLIERTTALEGSRKPQEDKVQ